MAQKQKREIFLSEREKVGGEKGVSGGVWECGKPDKVFHHFHAPERGGKGGGDFLFKAAVGGALWLPLSPFPPAGDSPPQRIFFLLLFLYGGDVYGYGSADRLWSGCRHLYREKNEHLGEVSWSRCTPYEFYREIFPEGSFERKGHFEDAKGNGIAVTVPEARKACRDRAWRSRGMAKPNAYTDHRRADGTVGDLQTRTLPSCPLSHILGGSAGAARMPGISMPWSLTWMG